MCFKRMLLASAACVVLAGCATPDPKSRIGQEDPFLGEAVRYNAALQTINPEPVYPEDAAEPGSSGAKGAAAVARYRTDQVNARHRAEVNAARSSSLSTTQGTSSGGSGPR